MDSGRSVLMTLVFGAWIGGVAGEVLAAQAAAGQVGPTCGEVAKRLAGVWTAPQYRMKRGSQAGVQVFGANAFDVRDVELTVQPSGEGLLKISTSVVDEKKRTWAPTLVEANVSVGTTQPGTAGRCEAAVTVASAREQFLDETKYTAPLEGLRVALIADPTATQLDLRFETPKGDGSFWTTLRRQAGR